MIPTLQFITCCLISQQLKIDGVTAPGELRSAVCRMTGIEKCQCRKARMQRNYVACAILAWLRLRAAAKESATTMHQITRRWLSEYLRQELRSPALAMDFA